MRRTIGTVAALAVALLAVGGGAATAAKLVTGASIKDGSITLRDLSKGTKAALRGAPGATGAQGARGAAGPQGATGPAGAPGPAGSVGASRITVAFGESRLLCAENDASICDLGVSVARCPAGMVATGGGYEFERQGLLDAAVPVNSSVLSGAGWIVGMVNHGAEAGDFFAVAHCVAGTISGAVPGGLTAREAEARLRAAP